MPRHKPHSLAATFISLQVLVLITSGSPKILFTCRKNAKFLVYEGLFQYKSVTIFPPSVLGFFTLSPEIVEECEVLG